MVTVYLFRVLMIEEGNDVDVHMNIVSKEVYETYPSPGIVNVVNIHTFDYMVDDFTIYCTIRIATQLPELLAVTLINDLLFISYKRHLEELNSLLA